MRVEYFSHINHTMPNKHRYKKEIVLLCNQWHWTAEDVFQKLKKDYFFLWIGTVYRNLQELIEEGLLMKTSGILDKVIFEKHKIPHGHIVCHRSWMIVDVPVDTIAFDGVDIPANFNLQNINIVFDGHFVGDSWEKCQGIAHFKDEIKKEGRN